MNFLADKAVDCLFIFLGVYVAFAFSECHENKRKKDELRFNVEQIIKDLPKEAPDKTFENLDATIIESSGGKCRVKLTPMKVHNFEAKKHLDVIINRGLGTYLPSKEILDRLINLYESVEPSFKKEREKFFDRIRDDKYFKSFINLTDQDSVCKHRDRIVNHIKKNFSADYKTLKINDIVVRAIAYEIVLELKKKGFRRPKDSKPFTYFVDIDSSKEKDTKNTTVILKKQEFQTEDPEDEEVEDLASSTPKI